MERGRGKEELHAGGEESQRKRGDIYRVGDTSPSGEKNDRLLAATVSACFEIIKESLLCGVLLIDAQSRKIVEANQIALDMIGVPREKIVGEVCHQYICPEEQGRCPVLDANQSMSGVESVLFKENGESIPVLKTVAAISIEGHDFLLESFVDISERKKMEDALRESDAQLQRITNNMFDIITETDLGGVIQHVSPSNKSVLGYEPEEVIGTRVYDYMYQEDIDRITPALLRAIATSSHAIFEFRLRHVNGHYLWLESVVSPILDNSGILTGSLFVTRDINDRKRSEETLHAREEELRQLTENMLDTVIKIDTEGVIQY